MTRLICASFSTARSISDGMTETRFPSGSALDGTIDWIHQSFEVKTGGDVEKLKKGLVCLRLMDASGTVWLDDVQITEIAAMPDLK